MLIRRQLELIRRCALSSRLALENNGAAVPESAIVLFTLIDAPSLGFFFMQMCI